MRVTKDSEIKVFLVDYRAILQTIRARANIGSNARGATFGFADSGGIKRVALAGEK
jgi:hypothetical protein